MKWICGAVAGILLVELALATAFTGSWQPVLQGLGGTCLLLLCTVIFPRAIHLVGFLLSVFLLGLWWNGLMEMEYFGWPTSVSMAMHFYALSIAIAQMRDPRDHRLRSDTHWVFGLSFAMTFLPVYLLFAEVVDLPALPGSVLAEHLPSTWISGTLGMVLLLLNFMLLEFSRPVNEAKPWMRTPSALMRSSLFVVLLGTLLSASFLASSYLSQGIPGAMEWVRENARELRDQWASAQTNESSEEGTSPLNLTPFIQSMLGDEGALSLGGGPSTNNAAEEVMVLDIVEEADFEWLRRQTVYVRSQTQDQFLGKIWRNTNTEVGTIADTNGDGFVHIAPERPGQRSILHTVSMARPSQTVYAIAGVTDIEAAAVQKRDDGWYKFTTTPPISPKLISQPVRFEDVQTRRLSRPAEIEARYLTLPNSDLMRRISKLRRELPLGGNTLHDHIESCAGYLTREYTYSLKIENPEGRDWLENFLFFERKGYCSYFATALALMLRDAGIPTRVATGYSGGHLRAGTQWITFQQQHAHAWTEVYTEELGWIIVDATPPAPHLGPPADAPPAPADLNPENEPAAASTKPQWEPPPHFVPAVLLSICLLTLSLLLMWRVSRGRSGKGVMAGPPPAPPYFEMFCRKLKRKGHVRKSGATPREYLSVLRRTGVVGHEFDEMVNYYYRVVYRDAKRDPAAERGFVRQIKALNL